MKIVRSWANARLGPGAGLWERILFAFVPQHSQRDFGSGQRITISRFLSCEFGAAQNYVRNALCKFFEKTETKPYFLSALKT